MTWKPHRYSINQGEQIRDLKISEQLGGGKLSIANIVTEPLATSAVFILLGRVRGGDWDGKFVSIQLDFSKIWARECMVDETDQVKSDYFKWAFMNGTCHMGKIVCFFLLSKVIFVSLLRTRRNIIDGSLKDLALINGCTHLR